MCTIISWQLLSLKIHVIYFKMHSSFLHGLKVSSHWDSKTGCKCSTVLFLGNINIVLLDHIKMMAVTVARIWSISLQLLMNSSLAILSNSLIHSSWTHLDEDINLVEMKSWIWLEYPRVHLRNIFRKKERTFWGILTDQGHKLLYLGVTI